MSTRTPGDVRLRDVTDGDLPIFFEHQRDPDANRMAAFPARGWDAFLVHWTKILADETVTIKTILFEGHVAGNIVGWEQSGKREIGYWIGKEFWGKGVATRALSAFLGPVTVRPLYAHVAKHNLASIRVLEECGFAICGEDKVPSGTGGEAVEEFLLRLVCCPRSPSDYPHPIGLPANDSFRASDNPISVSVTTLDGDIGERVP